MSCVGDGRSGWSGFVSCLVVCAVGLFVSLVVSVSAFASPGWEVFPSVYPTHLPPGGTGFVELNVYNVGEEHSHGTVTVVDRLPEGVTATSAGFLELNIEEERFPMWDCSGIGTSVVTCTSDPTYLPSIPHHYPEGGIANGPRVQLGIAVSVAADASGTSTNEVSVSGGGALAPERLAAPITISSTPVSSFGIENFDGWFSSADGTIDTQAGSHPYETTFGFTLNTIEPTPPEEPTYVGGRLRNVIVNLPQGFVGDPNAVPQCPRQDISGVAPECPVASEIGFDMADLPFGFKQSGLPQLISIPVFNMVPPPGMPAQFGFNILGIPILLDASVRTGGDYGITEHVHNVPQTQAPISNQITLWGEPANPSHDFERWGSARVCNEGCVSGAERKPFLTLPTSCGGSHPYTMEADTWETLGEGFAEVFPHDSMHRPVGITGCDHLDFKPSISVAPDTSSADTPAGLTVEVKVPQEGLGRPEGLSMSNIKNTTVVLPKGVAINPGQAAGLAACQTAESAVGTEEPAKCPNASRVGTVQIETPLLRDKFEGSVYVLQSDPPNLKLLIAVSADGVNLKIVGDVHLDEATGQLTSTFTGTPELPFTDLKLSFSGGAQAALTTPATCGEYATSTDFTPWSTPYVPDAFPASNFSIDTGTNNAPCPPSPLPFSPSMIAGSTTDQAGGYTNFSLLLQRADDQQRIQGLQFKTPEGLLGMISKVPLCPEPQAAQGSCSPASQIGHTVVEAGPGPYPLVVPQPGQPPAPIYLTGGYEGAPYGLSIVVPLVVGPFTLQTQIVRARIEVDRLTAQITVTTDPLPTIIDGVPADLRAINAVIDRPGFMFNPTGCAPGSFSGTAFSNEGATAPISSHFQMGSCQSLVFKPNFRVSTSGKTSRKSGASLEAKILYPTGALGNNQASSQSNVRMVKVDLPKQLPSRLTTLQKACPAATFEANPANCPPASRVGTATAITPVLPVPVTGPAYFVSYGGAKFPELVIVLQGYGITVYLHGETFISKAGITSSTFRRVPDVPITSFDLKFPQGPFSALAANGNLCKSKLKMPTVFTGQNGAVIHQSTPIGVTGCAKAKKKGNGAGSRHKTIKHKKRK